MRAQSPTQVQLADWRALGNGSRSSTSAMTNSWARCGCEPPWPAPWVKLRCVFFARSYTPLVVNRRMALGSRLAKSGHLTRLGIFGSGRLAVCSTCGSCSISGHSNGLLRAVDVDALAILAGHVEQRAVDARRQVAVLELDVRGLDGERRAVCLISSLRIVPEPKQETYSAVAFVSASIGPTQCVAYHIGGRPGQ